MTQTDPHMQTQDDGLDAARADALRVTLGLETPIKVGDPMPPFFHYGFFWDAQLEDRLGRDGHPQVGGFIPDMGLPRRMWAGGRLEFLHPFLAGVPAQKRSRVLKTAHKNGRSGPLGFVTVAHEVWQNDALCVREEQDLVYRSEASVSGAKPVVTPAPDGGEAEARQFSTTQLFRYSALTFNGHRIHYDRAYARKVEGYEGLVVHGPLLAQYLMLLAEKRLERLSYFEFRGVSPVMDTETVELCWNDGACWVRGADGRLCLEAKAR